MMDISIRQLEALVSVIENRSFSKASESLFLSQSTISGHISQLESILKTTLLTRENKRQIEPTADGWKAYGAAREILGLLSSFEEEFNGDERRQPFINVSASTVPSRYLLPGLIAAYTEEHPGSKFAILEGDTEFALERLKTGEASLAFVGSKLKLSSFHFLPICKDQIVLLTPNTPEYQKLYESGVQGKDLLDRPMIMRETGSGTRREFDRYLSRVGFNHDMLKVIGYMSDVEAVKGAVAKGLGASIISEKAADDFVRTGQAIAFQLEPGGCCRDLYLAYQRNKRLSPKEQSFVSFAKKYFL